MVWCAYRLEARVFALPALCDDCDETTTHGAMADGSTFGRLAARSRILTVKYFSVCIVIDHDCTLYDFITAVHVNLIIQSIMPL